MRAAALLVLASCGVAEHQCRTAQGVRVHGADCDLVGAAVEGAAEGIAYRFTDKDAERFVANMAMLGEVRRIDKETIPCDGVDSVGCCVGFDVRYVSRVDGHCPEVILAHELAHAAGWSMGVSQGHDNEDLYGFMSVSRFVLGELRLEGCE